MAKTKVDLIKEQIAHYNTVIDGLRGELAEAKRKSTFQCPGCNKRTQVQNIEVEKIFHYVDPYSCSGGDYWKSADEYHIQCPKCTNKYRCYLHISTYDSPDKAAEKLDSSIGKLFLFINDHIEQFKSVTRVNRK